MSRHCARPGCGRPAVATLSYDYASGNAWIEVLAPDPHPMVHDLCGPHADGMRVPVGWQLDDRRQAASLPFQSSLAS